MFSYPMMVTARDTMVVTVLPSLRMAHLTTVEVVRKKRCWKRALRGHDH